MKILSQRDPKWSEAKIGSSNITVGRYGCTLTCISMLTGLVGEYVSPDKIASHKDWFTKDGLILWKEIMLTGVVFKRRDYNASALDEALKDPTAGVLLQVQGNHWVLCTGKSTLGGYTIADPWFGDTATTRRYNNEITGAAYFKLNEQRMSRVSAWKRMTTALRRIYARINRNH